MNTHSSPQPNYGHGHGQYNPYTASLPAAEPQKPRRWPWIVGVVVAFLLGVAVGGAGESTSSATPSSAPGYATAETDGATGPLALGTAVDVNGLIVNVTEIVTRAEYTTRLTCANVSYENRSDRVQIRHPWHWQARNPNGASFSSWLYTEKDALESGDLAPGGTDSGLVCFDVPRDKVAVIEFAQASLFNDGPDAEWAAES